ncbi:TPA: phage tail sheath family protein [Serratia marcescens]
MVEKEDKWSAPGIRLSSSVSADDERSGEPPSAIPVFIGWNNTPELGGKDAEWSAFLVPVATWDQWPACLRKEEGSCLQETVRHYFDNGGDKCWVLMAKQPPLESELTEEWWRKVSVPLLQEPTITLVAVPQLAERLEAKGGEDANNGTIAAEFITQWHNLLSACSKRHDLFFVLDAPRRVDIANECIRQLRDMQRLGEGAMHVALYGPHLVTDYPSCLEKKLPLTLPPCGAVLGVYARTDVAEGVWKAPANELLHHVIKPEFDETHTHRWFDVEHESINATRSFVGRGTRIWGCRTLSHGTRFRYVQVRRTVTWIEANLKQICRFAVFEPNNEITWFQLRGLCRAWLRRLWLDGGLAGTDETDAFSVRIGLHESMTADDIDAGRLVVQIEVAVLHAAEFIEVKLELLTGHAQVRGSETS